VLAAATARAVPVRRFFEPTDMEFEEPGMAELDMQFGLVRGEDARRRPALDADGGDQRGALRLARQRPAQLHDGVTWSPTDTLDVSVMALGGVLSGGDRWGLLIGISPKAQLWSH
jgi:hypothetical protein